jgi:hypothetical protein
MVMESGNEGIIDLHASVPDATRFHDRDTSKSAFRSSPSRTGRLLPREGTLVSETENLGRTLLLVEFENGQREYLFEHEVERENSSAARQEYGAGADVRM